MQGRRATGRDAGPSGLWVLDSGRLDARARVMWVENTGARLDGTAEESTHILAERQDALRAHLLELLLLVVLALLEPLHLVPRVVRPVALLAHPVRKSRMSNVRVTQKRVGRAVSAIMCRQRRQRLAVEAGVPQETHTAAHERTRTAPR